MYAKAGPQEYMWIAGLAPSTISAAAQLNERGSPGPPSSAGSGSRSQPASTYVRYDFLNDSGRVTVEVAGSKTGGLRSASANDSASGPSAIARISVSSDRAVSSSRSA